MRSKTEAVDINKIILDERCQPRVELNPEAVQEYADIYEEGEIKLPPLEVAKVDGKLVLLDGFHRLAGAREADHGFIRVRIVEECDIDRAIWLAAAANQGRGVRRSNQDKQRAVRMALRKIGIGMEQSTAEVAEHVGVSRDLVSRIREEVEADQSGRVKGRDGKSYPKRTKSQDVESTPCEPGTEDDTTTDENSDNGAPSERKPKKPVSPIVAMRKTLKNKVVDELPVFFEAGSEAQEVGLRLFEIVVEKERELEGVA